jgi:hypothetical protein
VLSSGIIDLVIGLAFIFGVTAALSSAITELIARFLGLRGAYLLQGLSELLDTGQVTTALGNAPAEYAAMTDFMTKKMSGNPPVEEPQSATGALLGSPILKSQGMVGQISGRDLTLTPANPAPAAAPAGSAARPAALPVISSQGRGRLLSRARQLRSLPSYISGSSFADAVIDMIVPDAQQETTMQTVRQGVGNLPDSLPALKQPLQALVKDAGDDIDRFRASVEKWYDDHMDRVSGWYKRRVAKITLVAGAILVLLLNINTVTIGRTLYNDSTVRAAVSSVAAKSASCPAGQEQTCLANLDAQLRAAAQAGLPLGWGTVPDCAASASTCNWPDQRGILSRHGGSGWLLALVVVGFLITVIALVPGARFWFDLLAKLGTLRSTGPKPAAQP